MDAARTGLAGVRAPSHQRGGELRATRFARKCKRRSRQGAKAKSRCKEARQRYWTHWIYEVVSGRRRLGTIFSASNRARSGSRSAQRGCPHPLRWARRAKPAVQMKPGDRGIDHPASPATRSQSKRTRPALTLSRRSWGARRGTARRIVPGHRQRPRWASVCPICVRPASRGSCPTCERMTIDSDMAPSTL